MWYFKVDFFRYGSNQQPMEAIAQTVHQIIHPQSQFFITPRFTYFFREIIASQFESENQQKMHFKKLLFTNSCEEHLWVAKYAR